MDDVTVEDVAVVTELLGRAPSVPFEVVVRDESGTPMVIRNAPLLDDGTPMPTRYWLVGEARARPSAGSRPRGGVRAAEASSRPARRSPRPTPRTRPSATRPSRPVTTGRGPSGGVGGTRQGVKCLHAHYAAHLAGVDDPVGRWVAVELGS